MDKHLAEQLGLSPHDPRVVTPDVPAKKNPAHKGIALSDLLKDRYHLRLSYEAIAEKRGTTGSNVYTRIKDFEKLLGDPDNLQGFVDIEDRVQAAIKSRYGSHLLKTDLTKCSPRDAAIVYGTIYDKHRLQTGQSTSNQSVFFHIVGESSDLDAPQDVVVDADFEDVTE